MKDGTLYSSSEDMIYAIKDFFRFLRVLYKVVLAPRNRICVHPKKVILYVGVSNIGDVVCVTPAFRAIKTQYPQTEVHVIGRGKAAHVLANHPHIDWYYNEPSEYLEKARLITAIHADAAISFFPGYPELATLIEGGVQSIATQRVRKGWRGRESLKFKLLSMFVHVEWRDMGEYAPVSYLRLLRVIALTGRDHRLELGVSSVDSMKVESILHAVLPANLPIIGVAPGGGSAYRDWSVDNFIALCHYITVHHRVAVVLIGAGRDKEIIDRMQANFTKTDAVFSFADQPIGELKALMKHLCIVICNDSAPAQFAYAFDIASIVLAGPTDEREHHAHTVRNRVIVAPGRGEPQTGSWNWELINVAEARRQMNEITLERVKAEFDDLLKIATM